MSLQKIIGILLSILILGSAAVAQDRSTGGIKGKAKVATGSASGISVTARQDDREIARTSTDSKGSFRIEGLAPGVYTLVFSKSGFSTGTISKIEVRAGKIRELSDKLYLPVDDGTLAILRGSIFDTIGHSIRGASVELFRLNTDGTEKKLDGRMTDETGQFIFRLTPQSAKYRVKVKMEGAEPASKDVEIDGAAIYRIALSLKPAST